MKTWSSAMLLLLTLMLWHVLTPSVVWSEPNDSLATKIDQIFAEWDKTISPGCALAVIRDSEVLYERGYGMANLEQSVPISPETVFYIASVSKQFTAMCILLLVEQGKLSLDDDIRKYVPEVPDYGHAIKIRHLLHHTSGIRDYLGLWYLGGNNFADSIPEERALGLIAQQKNLTFAPGEQFEYSNSGYFLLSVIVKRASGKSLAQFAHDNVFEPLEMHNTHFHDDRTLIVKKRAQAYSPRQGGGYSIFTTSFDLVGDGGLLTTVEDMYLWDQNYYHNILGKGDQGLVEQMSTLEPLNDGKKNNYGFGLFVGKYRDEDMISHSGGFIGFVAHYLRLPRYRFSVVCLSNAETVDAVSFAKRVTDVCLFGGSKEVTTTEADSTKITLDSHELESVSGLYLNPVKGTLKVTESDGVLKAEVFGLNFQIIPQSSTHFVSKDAPAKIEFRFEGVDPERRVAMKVNDDDEISYTKIKVVLPAAGVLPAYAGTYYSDELQATYRIALEGGKLSFTQQNVPETAFEPMGPDEFRVDWLRVSFMRDKGKRISGFVLNADGLLRNVKFVRK